MLEKRRAILGHLLKRRFDLEIQSWRNALKQNFDIMILCPSSELQGLVADYLTSQSNLLARIQLILPPNDCPSESLLPLRPNACPQGYEREATPQVERVIYVSAHQTPRGCAAVVFPLQSLEKLLPGAATMITMLLESVGLDRFIDAFDSQKLVQLKRIIERRGIDDFFDSVIQVAYIVGFRGDEKHATEYLESVLTKASDVARQPTELRESTPTSLDKLFEQLIELPDPHDTLKAALAHYVFHRRRVSQAEASRILKVSRSTLQSHLQLAERLKVATYFGAHRVHA